MKDNVEFRLPVIDPVRLNDKELLKKLLSVIDHTSLDGTDNEERISGLCDKALKSWQLVPESGVAAVCVFPVFVGLCKNILSGTPIKVASVAGAFPSGQSPLTIRLEEAKYALDHGADEIDMVISRGEFLAGNRDHVFGEVAAFKELCGDKHLKVILETGELKSLEQIMEAGKIAIDAGADFIKTSTGKIATGATPEAFYSMCIAIKKHFAETGKIVGIKPAGGISEIETAIMYHDILVQVLGKTWMTKELFRIGASRLTDKLIDQINEKNYKL